VTARVAVAPTRRFETANSFISYVHFSGSRTMWPIVQASSNPVNTVFDVKRLIGRKSSDATVKADVQLFPFTGEFHLTGSRCTHDMVAFCADNVSFCIIVCVGLNQLMQRGGFSRFRCLSS